MYFVDRNMSNGRGPYGVKFCLRWDGDFCGGDVQALTDALDPQSVKVFGAGKFSCEKSIRGENFGRGK